MPVEAVPGSFRQDLVDQGLAIKTEALSKIYEVGAEKVQALRGIGLHFEPAAGYAGGEWARHLCCDWLD